MKRLRPKEGGDLYRVPGFSLPFSLAPSFVLLLIFSELPEHSLESREHLFPLRERELGSLPFPGSESQPGFSILFEKL